VWSFKLPIDYRAAYWRTNYVMSSNVVFGEISPSDFSVYMHSQCDMLGRWAFHCVSISDKSNTFEMEVLGYLQQLGDEQQTTKMDGLPQSCTIGCQRSDDYYSFGGDGISVPYKCVPRLHCLVTNVAHWQELLNRIVVLSSLWMHKIAAYKKWRNNIIQPQALNYIQ